MIWSFLIASVVLAVTPGPGVFYVITRTLAQGKRAGLVSVAGVALGNVGNAVAASIGLAALFAISSLAFIIIKYVGAAYLIYLGVAAWRNNNDMLVQAPVQQARRIFRDGFWIALLNPKTTVFYAAFLPQFIVGHDHAVLQTIALGCAFSLIAAFTDASYVMLANKLTADFLSSHRGRKLSRYVTATAFLALGLITAFVDLDFS